MRVNSSRAIIGGSFFHCRIALVPHVERSPSSPPARYRLGMSDLRSVVLKNLVGGFLVSRKVLEIWRNIYWIGEEAAVLAAVCKTELEEEEEGTVFAYGQSNSGKTHTMRGSPTEPWIIPLVVNNLFDVINQGIYVAGLREEIVASSEQVLDLMEFGESHRHIGETNMNLYSSRSHTIFCMIIESRDKVEDGEAGNSWDAVRISVLKMDPSSTHVG
ncbi:centromere-associated protein E isoform X1 [Cucumis melo var. makuwa]|uniref:Centromere-associated protein E isoform X1 n=1 Tax=Cucumis melo var. makuwa TaxID=1194695 RepID=A0A5A7VCQ6_CUCMM|nr:centromere-associated protein E isoform X1 [Cucumis melo var. makuwa]